MFRRRWQNVPICWAMSPARHNMKLLSRKLSRASPPISPAMICASACRIPIRLLFPPPLHRMERAAGGVGGEVNNSRTPPDFIVRPAGPEDYTLAGELAAGVFSHGDPRFYEHFLHHWIASRPYEPGFDYRLHRLGVKDGQVVAHLRIRAYTLRYGTA